ncbi:PepSY-associated TM helix domain-containing protein [Sphingomonas beigongshangi]|uniref:PepSY-associated TM helix domain-containing protein n=1 Tax=Sphingomonas beigongshangi TaxID=2782540 RepID=UPI001FEDAE9C|nr:PepSY-associated TM helix domain-containing protein [Sphingomonas beigongshangi]
MMNRLAWRRTWFQVHKWIGLVLAILIVPLSLSGAALVWDEPLDRIANPARYAVTGDTLLTPSAYVTAAARVLKPGDRIAQLSLPDGRGPVVVAAAPAAAGASRGGPPARTMVYLDPPTARVLEVSPRNAGLVRFLHVLHGSLQLPGVGRQVVGWIGVAMMVSSFTGLWLWWPTVGKWVRGLRWRRHRNTDTNLHYLFGFWVALPLFVLSLTGAWISFPAFFGALSGEARPRGPDPRAAMRAPPVARAALTPEAAVADAAGAARGDLASITWPTEKSADWTLGYAGGVSVKVADDSGVAVATPARAQAGLTRTMRRIHDGTGMGPVWQTIIFLGGLLPAALAVTGVIMWWRARGWKAELAAKQRGTRVARG